MKHNRGREVSIFLILFPNTQTWNNTYSRPHQGMEEPPMMWMPIDF